MDPVALVCSVALEAAPLLPLVSARGMRLMKGLDDRIWSGSTGERDIVILEAGMGKTNSAHATTLLLERMSVGAVISFGVAGAYEGSGLEVGEIALADREVYGDEGVETSDGWLSCEGIGIPLLERDGEKFYNTFAVDGDLLKRATAALAGADRRFAAGPFVTVSSCSGTSRRGAELSRRHSALCETMEGAAVAHVCAIYGIPFLELRGISNIVEDRDRSAWDLAGAARAAAEALVLITPEL